MSDRLLYCSPTHKAMSYRTTYSRVDNAPESRAESTLEMVLKMNGVPMGRIQGLRRSGQAAPRPVQELGSDRNVEFVSGIKNFQGTLQSITIVYGDLVKRLVSLSGGVIDETSKSAMLSNMPEFDISVMRRGTPNYGSPTLYAPSGSAQTLAGGGTVLTTIIGCVIDTFEQGINVNETLIMESVSIRYIDEMLGAGKDPKIISPTTTF
jgi:hypothetical protein